MADDITVQVRGLAELKAQLKALPAKLRVRAICTALAAGARIVRDTARSQAPVLRKPDPRRTAGTVRDAIVVRTSKRARAEGNVGVFVNVRPLTRGQVRAFKAENGKGGAKNPKDPFYWRWLEFGRQGRGASGPRQRQARNKAAGLRGVRYRRALRAVGPMPAYGFLQAGAKRLQDALRKIEQVLAPAVQRIVNRQSNS